MSDVADVGDVLFGRGGFATRLAWTGAVVSAFVWMFAIRRIWRTEPSRHHLIARLLSSATMVLLDVVVVLVFWPPNSALPQVIVSADGARALAAFVVGVQIMAAIWQITAPPRGPNQNRQGPWKLRSMRRRPKVIVR
jgi:uncharacterized BrkB/YihY/UPF0761 family membrane protein